MKFAQSGGTFSGNYLQFLRGATTTFAVNATGTLMIGTSTPYGINQLVVCAQSNCTLPSSGTSSVMVIASTDGATTSPSIVARGTITQGAADFGEWVIIEGSEKDYAAGDLLSVSASSTGVFKKSSSPYDPRLAGVVSKTAGFIGSGDLAGREDAVIMALAGRVPVKVSGENGAIQMGDLITASSKPGIAMKSTKPGRVIGVALESFNPASPEEEGSIMVLVNPHWAMPPISEMLQGSESGMTELNTFSFDPSLTVKIGTLVAGKIYTEELTIGSKEKPSGFTIFDRITGNPYCVVMENGALVAYVGKCEGNTFTQKAQQTPTNQTIFIPYSAPSPSPSPSPEVGSTTENSPTESISQTTTTVSPSTAPLSTESSSTGSSSTESVSTEPSSTGSSSNESSSTSSTGSSSTESSSPESSSPGSSSSEPASTAPAPTQ